MRRVCIGLRSAADPKKPHKLSINLLFRVFSVVILRNLSISIKDLPDIHKYPPF